LRRAKAKKLLGSALSDHKQDHSNEINQIHQSTGHLRHMKLTLGNFSAGIAMAIISAALMPSSFAQSQDTVLPQSMPLPVPATDVPAIAPPNAKMSLADFNLRLKALYPNTQFASVSQTPVAGLFEVQINKNIAYIDASGKHFLFGHLYDMTTQTDLTAIQLEKMNRVDFSQLNLNDAIKTVKGNGARKIAVFSDPDCGYCKQLEQTLAGATDVTIYTFLYPLAQIHPQAKAKAIAVWCAKDRGQAWANLMINNKQAPQVQCDHPLDRIAKVGQTMGIRGTPLLIASDGRQQPGALPLEALEKWLAQSSPSQQPPQASSGINGNNGGGVSVKTTAQRPAPASKGPMQ
jgi:thiol:disulfide interchange protein DsbC